MFFSYPNPVVQTQCYSSSTELSSGGFFCSTKTPKIYPYEKSPLRGCLALLLLASTATRAKRPRRIVRIAEPDMRFVTCDEVKALNQHGARWLRGPDRAMKSGFSNTCDKNRCFLSSCPPASSSLLPFCSTARSWPRLHAVPVWLPAWLHAALEARCSRRGKAGTNSSSLSPTALPKPSAQLNRDQRLQNNSLVMSAFKMF